MTISGVTVPADDETRIPMNIAEYKARRTGLLGPSQRPTCRQCRKALSTCYCHLLRPFNSPVPFVILQHLAEARNSIATARMTSASIRNCELITGNRFEHDARVNELLADSGRRHVLLFPRPGAAPLEHFLVREAEPVFWLIDAKWAQVPKMLRFSPNVRALEAVAFEPPSESIFSSIRTQPHAGCLSTLEAVFHVIDRVKRHRGEAGTEHHALLDVFRHMVRQQLEFVRLDVRRHGAARALRKLGREP